MASSSHRFRIQGKAFFLTYSQCPREPKDVGEFLTSHSTLASHVVYVRVQQEKHQDGNNHLHAIVCTSERRDIRDPRIFDFGEFHPKIETCRSVSKSLKYIQKEAGSFYEHGTVPCDKRLTGRKRKAEQDEWWHQAVNSGTIEEALQLVKDNEPRTFWLQHHNLVTNARRIWSEVRASFVPKYSESSFSVPRVLSDWVANNLRADPIPDRPLSLIIEGDSRTGKTAWARSLGRHNYLSGHLDLNGAVFDNEASYNVIDDVTPKYLKHWKEFLGAQKDWQSNLKYGKPVLVKGGKPAIVLCNSDQSYKCFLDCEENHQLRSWTSKNAVFVDIQDALFGGVSLTLREQTGEDDPESPMWASDSDPGDQAV
ncbi:replication associated protein [Eragrostis curvula streak virus]|uniref:Replication-associated protein n=1 Tax=Eragrostis curvula streak virus TaxID=638358 RepID=C3UV60_9GEMI|nr:replication associated protein [Eragrostis curvula streak virus]ACO88020.1 replication associated protein [Eragrostis curvula streak virus]